MRRAADAEVLAVLHRHNASPYSAVGNGQLLDRVPEPLRLVHYTRRAIPAEYAASFGYYHRKIGDVHLDGLPEPMQRELMFVVWRIVELGGRVPCGPLGLLARELAGTAATRRGCASPRCGSSRRCWRPTACAGPPSRPGTARWSCSAGGSAAVAWTHHCSATTRRSCDR